MAFCGNCFREIGNSSICSFCGYDAAADMAKHAVALRVGSILNGRYIVGRVLGQGGFGITYCALDYENKRLVAIKEHYPSALVIRTGSSEVRLVSSDLGASFNEGKEKFLDEAKTLSQFNGLKNVCDIYSYFEENGTAYFAMEYVDGIALDEYLKRQGRLLGFEEALRLLLPVMQTLSRIHSAGIIHRDLAPDNIMITPYNGVMLIDFGAARYSMGEKSRSLDVILKHGFAPKEQYARRSRQGAYTDVYALAATLYFAITGKVPPDAIERSDDDELIPPSKLGIKIPHKAEQVLLKALAVDYKNRFQTMDEFIQRLTPFLPDLKKEMEAKLAAERKTQAEKLAAERKAEAEKREAERKAKAERRTEERKSAEEKRLAEKKALEEIRKTKEEQKALEAAKRAEAKAAKKAKPEAPKESNKKKALPLIAVIAVLLAGAGVFFSIGEDQKESPVISEAESSPVIIEKTPTPTESPVPTDTYAALTWELSDDGSTFTISGNGPMREYRNEANSHSMPWPDQARHAKKLVISEGITSICDYAFYAYSMGEVVLPQSLEAIGSHAFSTCTSLRSVEIPGGVKNIKGAAFRDCSSLQSVSINAGTEKIGLESFRDCSSLNSMSIPNTVTEIGQNAFDGCERLYIVDFGGAENQWENITAGSGNDALLNANIRCALLGAGEINNNISWTLDSYGALTISGTGNMPVFSVKNENNFLKGSAPWCSDELRGKVRSVVIGHGITDVGKLAFVNCTNLREVSFPETLEKIGNSAFHCCDGLTELNFPEGFKKVDAYAFNSCRYIRKVCLPASLESIGEGAFQFCNGLGTVEFGGSKEQWENIYIVSINNEKLLNANIRCALIAAGEAGENISWALDNSGTLTISGKGEMEKGVPSKVAWYDYRSDIRNVVIDEGVSSIGSFAFYNCNALQSVSIPDTVTQIGEDAFVACTSLRSIVIPESVSSLATSAFQECSALSSITMSEGITHIGSYAFGGCSSLREVTLPDSITSIGQHAFNACWNLNSINIPAGATNLSPKIFVGCSSLRNVCIPEGIVTIPDNMFHGCTSLSSIVIPGSVTSIGSGAFDQCTSLRYVEFNGSKEQWGTVKISTKNEALLNANISFTAIASGKAGENISWVLDNEGTLTISGEGAMENYTASSNPAPWRLNGLDSKITKVVIGPGVTSVGSHAFWNCSQLREAVLCEGIKEIGLHAFRLASSLSAVDFPDSLEFIGDYAFSGCSLRDISLPKSIKGLGKGVFNECGSLRSITIPEGIENLPDSLFFNCNNLSEVTLPGTLKSINNHVFSHTRSLSSIVIPEGVTSLGASVFDQSGLTHISLPSSIELIGNVSFRDCSSLRTVQYTGSKEQWNKVKIISQYDREKLNAIVEFAAIATGEAGENISWVLDNEGTLTISGEGEMKDFSAKEEPSPWVEQREKISKVYVSPGITHVGSFAFYNCTNLQEVSLPEGLTSLGGHAFSYCSSLSSIELPDSLHVLGTGAFSYCTSLQSISIPEGTDTISDNLFIHCYELSSISLPRSLKYIKMAAFAYCSKLSSVSYAGTEEQWDTVSIFSVNDFLKKAEFHFAG